MLRLCAALSLACAALSASCDLPVLACDANVDCPRGFACIAGACRDTAAVVDAGADLGTDAGSGEGEGDAGEGEGSSAGEGEGASAGEGEGEGASGAEGEGAIAGEGEGASAGEGEGEGEGAPPSSCAAILASDPGAASGVYTLDTGGVAVNVECDMTTAGGGWALLARYDEGEACPSSWIASARGCVRVTDAAETSALFTPPYAFREMRGSVRALGFGVSEAFRDSGGKTIDDTYVDGMSITVGNPRNHVFTFAHGKTEAFIGDTTGICPCDGGTASPSFVGANYLCEQPAKSCDGSDNSIRFFDQTDVLFDGQDIPESTCVGAPESSPDFQVDLGVVHTEEVELRLLDDEASNNEDVAVIHMDLWVR